MAIESGTSGDQVGRDFGGEEVAVQPHDFYTLVPQQNASGGMLLRVTVAGTSPYIGFMEGCVRAYIDDNAEPIHLSSGTEDYFEGAYFFDAGHSAKSDGMSRMLRRCVDEFASGAPMASAAQPP